MTSDCIQIVTISAVESALEGVVKLSAIGEQRATKISAVGEGGSAVSYSAK